MKIAIIGSRGIPARYGGFETLAERLSSYLSSRGHRVTVIGEQAGFSDSGVRSIKTRFSKRQHPVLFYFESVVRTLFGYDRVLILGVGAGLYLWLYRLTRTRFITHVDGMEQLRGKFSDVKRWFVRISQRGTVVHSKHIVADADSVAAWWSERMGMLPSGISVLRYGADQLPALSDGIPAGTLLRHGYFLVIARIVPENNIAMIIDGFLLSGSARKLVVIGNWNDSEYGRKLRQHSYDNVVVLDPVYDKEKVAAYRAGCLAYLHGHSVGGTNPTLVEALGAGSVTVCHDNLFNRETTDSSGWFFTDAASLAKSIRELEALSSRSLDAAREISLSVARHRYDWSMIGGEYERLFLLP